MFVTKLKAINMPVCMRRRERLESCKTFIGASIHAILLPTSTTQSWLFCVCYTFSNWCLAACYCWCGAWKPNQSFYSINTWCAWSIVQKHSWFFFRSVRSRATESSLYKILLWWYCVCVWPHHQCAWESIEEEKKCLFTLCELVRPPARQPPFQFHHSISAKQSGFAASCMIDKHGSKKHIQCVPLSQIMTTKRSLHALMY